MSLCLALGIGVAALPAEASEVVKLARLVAIGKRSTAETPRTAQPEPRPTGASPQAHRNSTSDEAGTPPARGVS